MPQHRADTTSTPRACLPSGHCQGPVPQGRAAKARRGKAQLPHRRCRGPVPLGRSVSTGRPRAQPLRQAVLAYRTGGGQAGVAALPLSLSSRSPAQAPPQPDPAARFAPQSCRLEETLSAHARQPLRPGAGSPYACAMRRPLLRRRRETAGGQFSQQPVTNVTPGGLRVRSRSRGGC